MVTWLGLGPKIVGATLLAQAAGGDKLPEPTRAAVLMALLGFALLGMLLVVVILLGGHWVRRQGSFRRGSSVPPDRRPIVPVSTDDVPINAEDDDFNTGETIINRTTRHDESG